MQASSDGIHEVTVTASLDRTQFIYRVGSSQCAPSHIWHIFTPAPTANGMANTSYSPRPRLLPALHIFPCPDLYGIHACYTCLVPLIITALLITVPHIILPPSQRSSQRARQIPTFLPSSPSAARSSHSRCSSSGTQRRAARSSRRTSSEGGYTLLARIDLFELVDTLALDRSE